MFTRAFKRLTPAAPNVRKRTCSNDPSNEDEVDFALVEKILDARTWNHENMPLCTELWSMILRQGSSTVRVRKWRLVCRMWYELIMAEQRCVKLQLKRATLPDISTVQQFAGNLSGLRELHICIDKHDLDGSRIACFAALLRLPETLHVVRTRPVHRHIDVGTLLPTITQLRHLHLDAHSFYGANLLPASWNWNEFTHLETLSLTGDIGLFIIGGQLPVCLLLDGSMPQLIKLSSLRSIRLGHEPTETLWTGNSWSALRLTAMGYSQWQTPISEAVAFNFTV